MRSAVLAQLVPEIDLASGVDAAVDWIVETFEVFFDIVNIVVDRVVEWVVLLLSWPPDLVMIALLAAVAWWIRSWKFALFTAVALLLVSAMGFWEASMETLGLVLVATIFASAFGLPIGILAARSSVASAVIRPVLDFMQTMPAFVYLLVAFIFFSIGVVSGLIASMIFAMPPAVRLTELGIRQVDKEVVEAAEAFGARPSQVLRQVQIPLAMPTIMAGVNQVIMLTLSMVVIAGLAGAGGLGELVVRAISRIEVGLGFTSGLAIVILAIYLDRLTGAIRERSGTPAGK